MKYLTHLKANWKVAIHSLNDFFEHFLHGLVPYIHWKHKQGKERWHKWNEELQITNGTKLLIIYKDDEGCEFYGLAIFQDGKLIDSENKEVHNIIAWTELIEY